MIGRERKFVDEFQIQFAIFNPDSYLFWNGNISPIILNASTTLKIAEKSAQFSLFKIFVSYMFPV